jgi:hypothetical protein
VNYLSATVKGGFKEDILAGHLLAFEFAWQTETWGINTGEEWAPTGDLHNILVDIKSKWGYVL